MYGNLGDKEMMGDVLAGQKMITGIYNTFSNECTNDALRTDMLTILREEHNIQADVFNEMKKRVITMKKGVVISDEVEGGYIDED